MAIDKPDELGLYYLQSRYYNPEMGRFINADALVTTGQGLLGNNMFAYCNNNPVLFVDPSGLIIVLATNATTEQIAEYERAIAYINTSETGRKLITILESSSVVTTIVFVDNDDMGYNPATNTIYFDINSGMVLSDYVSTQSAALGLAHEMGHAAQNLEGMLNGSSWSIDDIEESNLKTYETPIANELGEPTRSSYYDNIGTKDMLNSTHFTTAVMVARPWWHYVLFWKLFVPNAILTEHNLVK